MRPEYALSTKDHFCVLRRWNSYTPKLPGSEGRGGGYLLRWNGKGIIIDPGFNFLENLDDWGYSLQDIDAIFLTHSHIDHTDSLDSILMMLERRLRTKSDKDPVRIYYDDGCEIRFGNYLSKLAEAYKFLKSPYKYRWANNEWQTIYDLEDWGIKVVPLPTYHKQIVPPDEDRGVGLIFCLSKGRKPIHRIAFTGDTRFVDERGKVTYIDLNLQKLKQCDIVICHIGDVKLGELLSLVNVKLESDKKIALEKALAEIAEKIDEVRNWDQMQMLGLPSTRDNFVSLMLSLITEKPDAAYLSRQHLGFHGVFRLFEALKDDSETKLGIISEFGEELGSFRHRIARTITKSLDLSSAKKKLLTGDLGLRVILLAKRESCPACLETTKLLVTCTTCGQLVCPFCIKETCIKHKQKGIFYHCPKRTCRSEEFAPPITKFSREKLAGY